MKLTVNIHRPVLMTLIDSGGQRSRSQQAVEVAKASTLTLVEVCLIVRSRSWTQTTVRIQLQ